MRESDAGVFTQPGSKADLTTLKFDFRYPRERTSIDRAHSQQLQRHFRAWHFFDIAGLTNDTGSLLQIGPRLCFIRAPGLWPYPSSFIGVFGTLPTNCGCSARAASTSRWVAPSIEVAMRATKSLRLGPGGKGSRNSTTSVPG
jgi:hypothetical protein